MTKSGEANPNWNPDSTSVVTHRRRARIMYPIASGELCERCKQQPAVEHHHVDNNPLNNEPSNVQKLCRKCHREVDGRTARMLAAGKLAWRNIETTCVNCGAECGGLRKDRCKSCYEYERYHGYDKPMSAVEATNERKQRIVATSCVNCGSSNTKLRKNLCSACYTYAWRWGIQRPLNEVLENVK